MSMRTVAARTLACLTLLLASLSACISTTPMTHREPTQKYVDVPTPASTRFVISNAGDAKTFIPIYGYYKHAQASRAQSELEAKLHERNFDPAIELQKLLVAKLASRDVKARALQVVRPIKMIPPKLDPRTLPLQGDTWAVLDARISGVALEADMSGEFRPVVALKVQLIEVPTRRVLYDNGFAYNLRIAAKAVDIPYDPRTQWPDIMAVEADVPGVMQAVSGALDRMADLIAQDISGNTKSAK